MEGGVPYSELEHESLCADCKRIANLQMELLNVESETRHNNLYFDCDACQVYKLIWY